MVMKNVLFEIDEEVWAKFKILCNQGDGEREPATVSQTVAALIREYCASQYTVVDARAGARFPNLIGS